MESNKQEPLSLRAVGAFTVYGSKIYEAKYELENWEVAELEKCVDRFLEYFYHSIQNATINTYLAHIKSTPYHQELREALTYVHNGEYPEAFNSLKDLDNGIFTNGDISINNAIREYCKTRLK